MRICGWCLWMSWRTCARFVYTTHSNVRHDSLTMRMCGWYRWVSWRCVRGWFIWCIQMGDTTPSRWESWGGVCAYCCARAHDLYIHDIQVTQMWDGIWTTYYRNLGVMSVGVVLFAFVRVHVINSYVRHDSLICEISRIHTCETWRILCIYMWDMIRSYAVAMISRIDYIIGLFCRI